MTRRSPDRSRADRAAVRRYQRASARRVPGASPFNVVHLDLADGLRGPATRGEPVRARRRAAGVVGARGGSCADDEPTVLRLRAFVVRGRRPTRRSDPRRVRARSTLEPWGGAVMPHEHDDAGPGRGPARALRATGRTSPRSTARSRDRCEPSPRLLDARVPTRDPSQELVDEEGVRHRLWRGSAAMSRSTTGSPRTICLIADGHHRYTTALAYRDERHAARRSGTVGRDPGPDRRRRHPDTFPCCPTTACSSSGRPPAARCAGARTSRARWQRVDDDRPRRHRSAGIGRWVALVRLARRWHGAPPAVRALHEELLDRHAPGDALRFTHSATTPSEAVRSGDAVAAYILPPTTPERVLAAIDARRAPAAQVDVLLAQAPYRAWCSCPCADRRAHSYDSSAAGSSRLIPVATTSVRLRAPAPLR